MKQPGALRGGIVVLILLAAGILTTVWSQNQKPQSQPQSDAVVAAQQPESVPVTRPEQRKTPHDQSADFKPANAEPSSPEFVDQPKGGKITGFDFYRDPLNSDHPNADPAAIQARETANKPNVMAAHRKMLEARYNLTPKLDPEMKMSRGKPLPVGPTVKLAPGMTWDQLAALLPADIKQR